jgi:hypothetical protein
MKYNYANKPDNASLPINQQNANVMCRPSDKTATPFIDWLLSFVTTIQTGQFDSSQNQIQEQA